LALSAVICWAHLQVLAGVGVRSKAIIKLKSINIYAFGVYVQPDHLVAQLGEKYNGIPPEVLRDQPEFFNDLLRHEVDMTVRLVVHYKGLNMGMVRRSLICPFNTLCLSHHVRYIWWNCVQLF
jgi:hypothetical protein